MEAAGGDEAVIVAPHAIAAAVVELVHVDFAARVVDGHVIEIVFVAVAMAAHVVAELLDVAVLNRVPPRALHDSAAYPVPIPAPAPLASSASAGPCHVVERDTGMKFSE